MIAANPDLVNAHDRAGATPLHHAAGFGNLATMKLLVEHGADVTHKDKDGYTPLWYARRFGDPTLTRLLRQHGAKE